MPAIYADRRAAGNQLAQHLQSFSSDTTAVILALPRGGVPVGYELARQLQLPLDVFLVRKLGVPGHEELAMGAIASGGVRVLNQEVVRSLEIPAEVVDSVAREEQEELNRRGRLYRAGRPAPELRGKTVILVDDGLATGSTMRVAVAAVRQAGAGRILVAIPVAPSDTCERLAREADSVVCPVCPQHFHSVGEWYADFAQTTDDEVNSLLTAAAV